GPTTRNFDNFGYVKLNFYRDRNDHQRGAELSWPGATDRYLHAAGELARTLVLYVRGDRTSAS
ncbi:MULTISPECIES: hypothetical protein, partial [unclassified Paraburkholderia]|uniref:hypothetical protein n=1 Tax=unclassified Paraburkholderia TaxID=2615204 RepID=UPI002AB008C4